MATTLLNNGNVVLPDRTVGDWSLVVRDGKIDAVLPAGSELPPGEAIDLGGSTLMAGFIDVHNHGAIGIDVNEADMRGLTKIAGFLTQNGVTAWMPTLVPGSDENYVRAVAAIDELMLAQGQMPIAQAVGIHYEGVFASEKMCGALRAEFFRKWQTPSGYVERTTPSAQSGGHPPS